MQQGYTIKLNKPEDTAESIAKKLNSLNGAIEISAIKDGVTRSELMSELNYINSNVSNKLEDQSKKTFNHIEATYSRVNGSNKMKDLRFHGGGTPITVSAIAPTNPKINDLWFDIS